MTTPLDHSAGHHALPAIGPGAHQPAGSITMAVGGYHSSIVIPPLQRSYHASVSKALRGAGLSTAHVRGDAYLHYGISKRLNDYLQACHWTARTNDEYKRMDRVDWRDFGITLEHASPQFSWLIRLAVPIARWSQAYFQRYEECFRYASTRHQASLLLPTNENKRHLSPEMIAMPRHGRLDLYIKMCVQAARTNKAHPTSCRTVDPLYYDLAPLTPHTISREFEGLLHSMQGIAEFRPNEYDSWSKELRHYQELETRLIDGEIARNRRRGGIIVDKPALPVEDKLAATPARPRRLGPLTIRAMIPFAHIMRDKAWEQYQGKAHDKMCGMTKEQVNKFYARMNGKKDKTRSASD